MSLILPADLLKIADRAAYQYGQIQAAFNAIRQQGAGNGYYWEIVTATNNPDLEIDVLKQYKSVDSDLDPEGAARNGTYLSSIIGAMNSHFNRRDPNTGEPLQVGGWDGYLWDHSIRVSAYFAALYHACMTPWYMRAVNVFSESVDTFATLDVSSGPSLVFTDGVDYGDGSILNPANGFYFAATQLKAVVATFGATDLDVRLSVKDVDNLPTTIDFTITAGTLPGAEIDIGLPSDRFLDVTGAVFVPGGSGGTLGDKIYVRNKKERQVAL